MKVHQLQHIAEMPEILFAHGVRDVVISPGSRNAPLIKAFFKRFGDGCKSLVDERSAAYFALGQSLATKKPTVLICTSGTAVLNYAPAIAEAFYQQVPLLIITADRPTEWIGQLDNQAIRQNNVFGNNIKASFSLPVTISHVDELWFAHRMINEAFHKTVSESAGPVHINVPLREPLYETLPGVSQNLQVIRKEETDSTLSKNSTLLTDWEKSKSILIVCGQLQPDEKLKVIRKEETDSTLSKNSTLLTDWEKAKSILIVCGQLQPDEKLKETIQRLSGDSRVVIVAEPISNQHFTASINNPEVTFNSKINYPEIAVPELVIYIGGQVVSKKIKLFLRGLQNSTFYRISTDEQIIDTFQNLTAFIHAVPHSVIKGLKIISEGEKSIFWTFWENENRKAERLTEKYFDKIAYSDLLVFKEISALLPNDAIVFAGNSSVVRYLFYFDQKSRKYYSNRGVSGIDGCLSAASGLASKTDEPVYVIVGDLAFAYDSNALWNRELPKNLKIILINNEGGGIFHLLKGPSESEDFLPFVNAHHPIDFKKLTEAFGVKYNLCSSENELQTGIKNMVLQNECAKVLEIKTPNHGEPHKTKDFFKFLNNNYDTELGND